MRIRQVAAIACVLSINTGPKKDIDQRKKRQMAGQTVTGKGKDIVATFAGNIETVV
jgi:hypothetical protein